MPVYLPGLTFGGLGYGGASYGYSPYGSGAYPRLPVPTTGGYGGAPYGFSSYGSVDILPPRVTGAVSLDGFRVEVFFSEEMALGSGATSLLAPSAYVFTETHGAPLTTDAVVAGTPGPLGGYTSVIVSHSGSTLGGQYIVAVTGPTDMAGNPIGPPPTNRASFLAFGDTTTVSAALGSPDDGRTVNLHFLSSKGDPQALLTEAEFSPGVEDPSTYEVTTSYPVPPTVSSAVQASTLSEVSLDVHPMTSTSYTLIVGPSTAIVYKGGLLPDDDPTFTGVEIGTGTSNPTVDGLLLTKPFGDVYGWSFGDTTGRVIPGSSYQFDFTYDLSGTVVLPPIIGTSFATFSVSDGAIQIDLTLRDVAGVKVIDVVSGAYTAQIPAAWESGNPKISVVRNIRGAFYSVLFGGVPVLTFPVASATGVPTYAAGCAVVLSAAHQVTNFNLRFVECDASSTLFTSAWNFLHHVPSGFIGSSVLTRDRIITKRGPLVRGWGDATPATKEDVTVTLDPAGAIPAGEVEIRNINPYVGEIYPTIPIPLAAAGAFTVEVDYTWFSNPPMELSGLNTRGLTLNTWDRAVGHTAGAMSPVPSTSVGAPRTGRFPMGVVLGPYDRPSPKQIGHRYIGWQKDYSALLNAPTTLLLNQNPNSISVGGLTSDALLETGLFNGRTKPQSANTPWTLVGVDPGSVLDNGYYRVIDDSTGPYGVGTAAFYQRPLDLSLETAVTEISRFKINSYELDGVFTGVGMGIYDGSHLAFIGALVINGVQHVGLLLDASAAHLEAGWAVGPFMSATALSQTTLKVDSLLSGVGSLTRFRIPTGTQQGTYTISNCGLDTNSDGEVEVTFSPALPAPIGNFESGSFTILPETLWDTDPISLRLYSQWPQGSVEAYIGGEVSGLINSLGEVPAYPAQTALLLPATEKGIDLWGSVSRRAESVSDWDLTQYTSTPQLMVRTVQGITALSEMGTTPQDDPNDPWYEVGKFGYSRVDSSGDTLLLKATSAGVGPTPDLEYSFERVEPYLTPKVSFDGEATFKVESGILGAGDAAFRVRDTVREAHLKTIFYEDVPSAAGGYRRLKTLPQSSLSGLQDPVSVGWVKPNSNDIPDPFVRGQTLLFSKGSVQSGLWSDSAVPPVNWDWEGAIIEGRLSVDSYTVGTIGTGAVFGGFSHYESGGTSNSTKIAVGLGEGTVLLLDQTFATVASFPVAWNDSNPHTYRLLCDPVADIVVLVVDDVIIGSVAHSLFASLAVQNFGAFVGGEGTGVCEYTLHSLSTIPLRATTHGALGRTFGIWLGGDLDDIDSYRIPRSDFTFAPNSSLTAHPVDMDWREFCRVRMYLDPTWGVSFYRPDLALPPTATEDFATETTDPSAAWINVEYSELPLRPGMRAAVSFGSMDRRSISQQRWDSVRYRVRGAVDGFGIAPEGMVLNRSFTFTSGELNVDTTPEVVTVTSRTATTVYVPDCAMYADRVFVVQVDGVVLPASSWSFDQTTQVITLPLLAEPLYPVTITFAAGHPISQTYLCSQPWNESVTLLNEGTPPVPSDLDEAATREVRAGSVINDPDDVLDEAESLVLNDPYRFIKFTDEEDALYSDLHFCTVEDGDSVHITTLCDGPGPGTGLSHLEIEGGFTTGATSVIEGPAGPWKGSPTIKGSSTHFDPASVLLASGGVILGGTLGPGTAILYPNQRGPEGTPPEGNFGINQDFGMDIRWQPDIRGSGEIFDIPTALGDNVPPTSANPGTNPNPDAAPTANGHGAVAYQLDDWDGDYSHLGPWGGMSALSLDSLLAGGSQLNGTEFTLEGGSQIMSPTITTGYIRAAN